MKTIFTSEWKSWIQTNVDNGHDKDHLFNMLIDEDFSYGASVIVADDENVAKNMGEISPLQNSNRMQIDTQINDTLNSVIMMEQTCLE